MKSAPIVAVCLVAATGLVAACAADATIDGPRIPASDAYGGPHHGDETFILYIGKESSEYRTLDFEVAVDGKVVARDIIETKTLVQPQPKKEVRLALAPGEHVLTASTRRGDAALTQRFTITGKHWAYLAYWYYTGPGKPHPKEFTFTLSDKEIRFM
jgi:hypothetical protein